MRSISDFHSSVKNVLSADVWSPMRQVACCMADGCCIELSVVDRVMFHDYLRADTIANLSS